MTTTTAATAAPHQPARSPTPCTMWRQAFIRALPLVAFYVILVVIKDAPMFAAGFESVQSAVMNLVVSEVVQGLFVAAGVAVVETRGWTQRKRIAAYVTVAVVATVGTLLVFGGVTRSLNLSTSKWPWWVQFWGNSGPTLVHSLFAIALYRMWRQARERAAALREMQRTRVELLRQTAQADLLAMQARIDPGFLFDSLQAIDRAYVAEPARGRRLIDALIDYLRGVLPGIDSAASTLGKECDLARAYLELARERYCLDLHVEVAATNARSAPFPPMLVLPIVGDIVKSSRAVERPRHVLLRASTPEDNGALAIAVEPQYEPSAATLALVRERLAELSAGSVTVHDSTITLEVRDALATRADR